MIGINVSERDRTYTWSDLKPKQKSADLVAYEIARDLEQEKYREYCKRVDEWIANKQYDEMNEFLDECKRLEVNARQLYKQMNCDHKDLDTIGQDVYLGSGEWYYGEHYICCKCGKEFTRKP